MSTPLNWTKVRLLPRALKKELEFLKDKVKQAQHENQRSQETLQELQLAQTKVEIKCFEKSATFC